ncbi:hypothetical protein Ahy_A07g037377 [Arachis hypogaea]|uniref:Reverse transcriptase zinc-binding domain-containing protein n=1 Tax=Arachis hypogaea TaxID=3818 RepID=A0A445CIM1_ARAHY|nr:hypothetical protein Ahy_A07g037377 [Arachis hypogaea]
MRGAYVRGGTSRSHDPRERRREGESSLRNLKKVRKTREAEEYSGEMALTPRVEEWMMETEVEHQKYGRQEAQVEENSNKEQESRVGGVPHSFAEIVRMGKNAANEVGDQNIEKMATDEAVEEPEDSDEDESDIIVKKMPNGLYNLVIGEEVKRELRKEWWDTLIVKLCGRVGHDKANCKEGKRDPSPEQQIQKEGQATNTEVEEEDRNGNKNIDKGKKVIEEPADAFGPWMIVQRSTRGKKTTKPGEGTSSGGGGKEKEKERKIESEGRQSRFAVLAEEEPERNEESNPKATAGISNKPQSEKDKENWIVSIQPSQVLSLAIPQTALEDPAQSKPPDPPFNSLQTSELVEAMLVYENEEANKAIQQGVNPLQATIRTLKEIKSQHRPDITLIYEPKCSGNKATEVIKALGFNFSLLEEADGYVGGIWVLWDNPALTINILETHHQYVAMEVKDPSHSPWKLTAVYANNIEFSIGNGRRIRLWIDLWLKNEGSLIQKAIIPIEEENMEITLTEATDLNGGWDFNLLRRYLPDNIIYKIQAIHPPWDNLEEDKILWSLTPTGEFSIASTYRKISQQTDTQDRIWEVLWGWKGPQKIKIFMWLTLHRKLMTGARRRKLFGTGDECHRCNSLTEDQSHLPAGGYGGGVTVKSSLLPSDG